MTSQFYSAKLPGNKWINGIEFGVAQFSAYNLANLLLMNMSEVKAFLVMLAISVLGQLVLIGFPFAGVHIYIANFLVVGPACGMFSAWLLILERRVPPKNSGTVLMLSRTSSVGISTASPIISTLTPPYPSVATLAVCTMAFLAVLRFPPAGCYSSQQTQAAIELKDLEKSRDESKE